MIFSKKIESRAEKVARDQIVASKMMQLVRHFALTTFSFFTNKSRFVGWGSIAVSYTFCLLGLYRQPKYSIVVFNMNM